MKNPKQSSRKLKGLVHTPSKPVSIKAMNEAIVKGATEK